MNKQPQHQSPVHNPVRKKKKRKPSGRLDEPIIPTGLLLRSRAEGLALPPLQSVQRQADAAHLGSALGNRSFNRLMHRDSTKLNEKEGAVRSGMLPPLTASPIEKEKLKDDRLPVRVDLDVSTRQSQRETLPEEGHPDGVNGELGYASSVKEGLRPGPEAFGEEQAIVGMDQIRYNFDPSGLEVAARATVDCEWGVQSLGNTDIPDERVPQVTPETWKPIASDLTPDEEGIPQRKDYWSQDLTARHEQFHAEDDIQAARDGLPEVQTWLENQSTPSRGGEVVVMRMMEEARAQVQGKIEDHYEDGGETRAYADGKPVYERRAGAIAGRAAREGWGS